MFLKRLLVCILGAFLFLNGFTTDTILAEEKIRTLLVVPLDSRPVSTDVLMKVGDVSGVKVLLPPKNILGDLHARGDRKAIQQWVDTHAKEADGFLFSADMLAYGGLVASRTEESSKEEALSHLALLTELKKEFPHKKIYVYASLLRLAPSITKKEDVQTYEQVRAWGKLMGNEKRNRQAIHRLENEMTTSLLETIVNVRTRNLSVNKELIHYVQDGTIDLLLFGQDDAAGEGIHQVEKTKLKKNVEKSNPIFFLSGMDEVGSMLVTRVGLEAMKKTPSVFIRYDHPFAPFWTSPFDDTSVTKNIQEHLRVSGMKQTMLPFLADMTLYVNTPFSNVLSLPTKQVAVADIAKVNQSDSDLVESVFASVPLHELYSYSGWNTGGNSIGLSLSFAGARLISLQNGSVEATRHHAELLYRSLLLDNGYKSVVYPALKKQVERNQHDSYNLGNQTKVYEEMLNNALQKESEKLFQDIFKGKTLYHDLEQSASVTLEEVTLAPANFPWNRLFEIRLSPEMQAK